ncbi:MAG: hypothetical protein ACPGUE_11165 [Marinomonas sp.]
MKTPNEVKAVIEQIAPEATMNEDGELCFEYKGYPVKIEMHPRCSFCTALYESFDSINMISDYKYLRDLETKEQVVEFLDSAVKKIEDRKAPITDVPYIYNEDY